MRALAVVVAGLWLVPELAQACFPWPEGVVSVAPNGGTYPANAAVIIRGHQLQPDLLVATVDGQAAQLVVDKGLILNEPDFLENFQTLALRIEPPPTPGQTIHISGQPCEFAESQCELIDVTFTVGALDEKPPGRIDVVSFDLVRLNDFEVSDCGESGSYIQVEMSLAPDIGSEESLVMYTLNATHSELDMSGSRRGHAEDLMGVMHGVVEIFSVGEDFPIEGWCVAIHTVDAAGNESATASSCSPCMWIALEPNMLFGDEVWQPVPGGACDDGSAASSTGDVSSTGDMSSTSAESPASDATPTGDAGDTSSTGEGADESPNPDRGCTCRTKPIVHATPLMLALGLLARRRRRG